MDRIERAKQLETQFLTALNDAQDAYEQIIMHRAWLDLGFDTFGEWWRARVMPIMHSLQMRPTKEITQRGIEQVKEEEKDLPKAQKTTQREMGEMFRVDQKTVSNRTRSTFEENSSGADLAQSKPTNRRARAEAISNDIEKISELSDEATVAKLDQAKADELEYRRNNLIGLEFTDIDYSIVAAREEIVRIVNEIREIGLVFNEEQTQGLLSTLDKLDQVSAMLRETLLNPQTDFDEELRILTNGETA